MAGGLLLSQKDTAGVVSTATQQYTASGIILTQDDGRGNTTTTARDIGSPTAGISPRTSAKSSALLPTSQAHAILY